MPSRVTGRNQVYGQKPGFWGSARRLGSKVVLFLFILAMSLLIALLPLTWAAALILGSIVLVLTLIRPEYGLYLLIFAVPFGAIREIQLSRFTVGVTEALVGLVLAAWLVRMIAVREVRFPHPPLLLPLLVFLGAILLSWSNTFSLPYSVKETLKWIEVVALYLFVAATIDRPRARTVIACMLAAGSLQAVVGFYQFFGGVGPEHFVLFGRFMRAAGTFAQPNPFAGYLGLVLPLAYSLLLASFAPGEAAKGQAASFVRRGLWTAFYGVALALMGAAMIMSWSRGAWLGLGAAFVVVSVVRSRRAAVLFALAVVVLIFVLILGSLELLPEFITQRFALVQPYLRVFDVREVEVTAGNWAVVERMAHWQAGWYMFSAHPWLGVGMGNYVPIYPLYALPGWDEPLGHAHNYYLNVAAEAGLVGLSAYLLLWGACFWQAWQTVRGATGYAQAVATGILGVITHLTVHNLFDNLYVHGMYMHIAILLALLYVIPRGPGPLEVCMNEQTRISLTDVTDEPLVHTLR